MTNEEMQPALDDLRSMVVDLGNRVAALEVIAKHAEQLGQESIARAVSVYQNLDTQADGVISEISRIVGEKLAGINAPPGVRTADLAVHGFDEYIRKIVMRHIRGW